MHFLVNCKAGAAFPSCNLFDQPSLQTQTPAHLAEQPKVLCPSTIIIGGISPLYCIPFISCSHSCPASVVHLPISAYGNRLSRHEKVLPASPFFQHSWTIISALSSDSGMFHLPVNIILPS